MPSNRSQQRKQRPKVLRSLCFLLFNSLAGLPDLHELACCSAVLNKGLFSLSFHQGTGQCNNSISERLGSSGCPNQCGAAARSITTGPIQAEVDKSARPRSH